MQTATAPTARTVHAPHWHAPTKRNLALAAIVLVGLSYATLIQSFSWNQTSHYDLIRSLDNDRTTIDAYQENTGDKAFYKGHWYSARAPGLALFALPYYDALKGLDAEAVARSSQAQRGEDEMIYFVGLWANVLPGLVLLLLVGWLAEGLEPGYGAATAVILGLGTLTLPLSTLLFSHVFSACLGFAAFALLMRERAGPPNAWYIGVAGLLLGYAGASEYPLFFTALVLGLYLISRRDTFNPRGLLTRVGPFVLGGLVGIVPLLLYNHYAFHSWTHLAYSSIPRQQKGFFGIDAPSLPVLATLLLDSRGLLTLSPVLAMGGVGTWLLYRRKLRAEALAIAGICILYVGYNAGYYLPFGGGFMGPRFLMTMLPFLALPIGLALKRYPGPTIALAAVSLTTIVVATITHPLIGYETEAVVFARYLGEGYFQPTIASAFGLGRSWGAIWPFALTAGGAVVLAVLATARTRISTRSLLWGVAALAFWCAFAALAPTLLGIDHRGLLSIVGAGDNTALNLTLHDGSRYPLRTLAPLAAGVGLLALLATAAASGRRGRRRAIGSGPGRVAHSTQA
ncbi:MAG TPA: hypothetical protein VGY30_07430 [Solirubrobacteraceae bacterium]|jgi:hypothetical protein|nr:hypothetical protein [Solirubrobacteraceae bacterium]